MKIFIVSIEDDSSPRLIKFLSQPFFKNGQQAYVKVGVKGGELTAKQYFEMAVKGRSEPLAPSELGCSLSHLKALELFLESKDDYALILEDDAILRNDLTIEQLEKELAKIDLPSNVLFSLGGIQMKECLKTRGKFKKYNFLNVKVLEVVPDYYHRACYAFAYIVDKKMAETLIRYHSKIRKADDWSYLFDFDSTTHILMSFIIDHPVVKKGDNNVLVSTIEAERVREKDIPKSKYGLSLRRSFSKIFNKCYFS